MFVCVQVAPKQNQQPTSRDRRKCVLVRCVVAHADGECVSADDDAEHDGTGAV
jgi:hypothetical protein